MLLIDYAEKIVSINVGSLLLPSKSSLAVLLYSHLSFFYLYFSLETCSFVSLSGHV